MRTIQITKKPVERLPLPHSVQETIPIKAVYEDGIFFLGSNTYSKTFSFSDINWEVSNEDVKEVLFKKYNRVLDALDSNSQAMITINNRRLNERIMESAVMMPMKGDAQDVHRKHYNQMLKGKTVGVHSIVEDLYITLSTEKKSVADARAYFSRAGGALSAAFAQLGSKTEELDTTERLRIFHDFYRNGEESSYHFNLEDTTKKGQDIRDYLCPDSMEFKTDYFKMGDRYGRVMFLSDFASYIEDNVLTSIMALPRTMMFSITIAPLPRPDAIKMAERTLLGINTNITNWQRSQNKYNNFSASIPFEMENERTETHELLEDLKTRDQNMFFATLSLVHTADSKEALDEDTDALKQLARGTLSQLRVFKWQQWEGLLTTLPFGKKRVEIDRTLTTESLGIFMPFRVQEVYDEGGIYYGQNAISGNMIVADRKKLNNGNSFILGASGGGKSFMAKSEILSIALRSDADIMIIDPEREYSKVVEAVGGEIIRIAPDSDVRLNAMELTKNYGEGKNPLPLKSQFIMSLCEQIQDGIMLGPKEKSIIDRCTSQVYEGYIMSGYQDDPPTLKDFVFKLREQPEEEAHSLALGMERFTDGTLNMFAELSTVDINNRIICYDILGLGEQMRSVGLLVVLDAIWNRIVSNRSQHRQTFIFIDEMYLLFRHNYSAEYLDMLWKRVRKYGAYCTGITQNINEILSNSYASQMLSNSEFVIMFNQQGRDRESLEQLLNMSPEQMEHITDAGIGRGLIKIGNSIIPFVNQFPKDNPLYKVLTTKPGEI